MFLKHERAAMDAFLPGLDESLAGSTLAELERPGSGAIAAFRRAKGPGLLIPTTQGGRGATALDAVRIHRALGSRSPSLAIVSTMHSFSIATLVEVAIFGNEQGSLLLESIASDDMLMASGFAEGRSGSHILAATMQARRTPDGGYCISGSKKPCSISRSMDLLSASVMLREEDGRSRRAVVIVPADSPGIERRPFWSTPVLAAAESDEVILHDVAIPEDLLFVPESDAQMDPVEVTGYLWFQLLVSASYLGAASGLAERAILARRGGPVERAMLGQELEGAMSALEGLAAGITRGDSHEQLLGRALFVRYHVQGAIERATSLATELMGGMGFISSGDISYLLAASRALSFHPPARLSSASALSELMDGKPLAMV